MNDELWMEKEKNEKAKTYLFELWIVQYISSLWMFNRHPKNGKRERGGEDNIMRFGDS